MTPDPCTAVTITNASAEAILHDLDCRVASFDTALWNAYKELEAGYLAGQALIENGPHDPGFAAPEPQPDPVPAPPVKAKRSHKRKP